MCMMMVSSSSSHTRCLNKKCIRGGRYSLFFSLFLSFSITVVLLFSLFPLYTYIDFFFSSFILYLSILLTQLIVERVKRVHTIIHTFLGRVVRSLFILFCLCKQKQLLVVFNDWLQFDSFI
jgi:hypothetical protein